jgi:hypothetical protein
MVAVLLGENRDHRERPGAKSAHRPNLHRVMQKLPGVFDRIPVKLASLMTFRVWHQTGI